MSLLSWLNDVNNCKINNYSNYTTSNIFMFFFCNFEFSISAKLWLSPSLWCSENFPPRHPYDETRPATTQWKRYYSIVIKKNNSQVIIEIQGCPTLMLFLHHHAVSLALPHSCLQVKARSQISYMATHTHPCRTLHTSQMPPQIISRS